MAEWRCVRAWRHPHCLDVDNTGRPHHLLFGAGRQEDAYGQRHHKPCLLYSHSIRCISCKSCSIQKVSDAKTLMTLQRYQKISKTHSFRRCFSHNGAFFGFTENNENGNPMKTLILRCSSSYIVSTVNLLILSRKFWILAPKNRLLFELGKDLVQKTPKIDVFGSRWLSATSVFFTSFRAVKAILLGCQSYALRLSFVAFERLKCRKWQGQRPQVTSSKATNDKTAD